MTVSINTNQNVDINRRIFTELSWTSVVLATAVYNPSSEDDSFLDISENVV